MAVRVTKAIAPNSILMRQIEAEAARQTKIRLDELARQAVVRCDQIVSAEFNTADHRKAGRALLGSFQCKVVGNTFPLTLEMSSNANKAKVGALNNGAPPHIITGNPWLVFPVAAKGHRKAGGTIPSRGGGKLSTRLGTYQAGGKTRNVRTNQVHHPGNQHPHFMMERALEYVVNAAYRTAIKLERR